MIADLDSFVLISAPVVRVIQGVILPVLLAVLYKAGGSPWVKGLITIIASALTALITNAVLDTGTAVFSQQYILDWFMTWAPTVLMYVGVYSKIDINAKLGPGIVPPVPKT
jgi:chromate transport protein ChrA